MTPAESRLIGAGELGILAEIVRSWQLTKVQALLARSWLRDERRWPDISPNQREIRAHVLDRVCRRLVVLEVAPLDYFVGCGDALPDAPDDVSSLVGGGDV